MYSRNQGAAREIVPPVSKSVVQVFPTTESLGVFKREELARAKQTEPPEEKHYEYGRYGNATEALVEQELAQLDQGEDAVLFPSGMAAVTTTLLALCKEYGPGAHILMGAETYRQTRVFAEGTMKSLGIEVELVEPDNLSRIGERLRQNTRAVFLESPSNPFLRVADIEAIAKLKVRQPFHLIVDPTFASPINQTPLELGADLVVTSATKYHAGHNDLLAGFVAGPFVLTEKIRSLRGTLGCATAPEVAHRLLQYASDMKSRVNRLNDNGLEVARALTEDPRISRVWYPFLESHPEYEIATRTLRGGGGVLSFTVKGTYEDTQRFVESCRVALHGPSFGCGPALISHVADMSFFGKSEEELRALGLSGNLVRLSVGTGPVGELISDLKQALSVVDTPHLPSPAQRSELFFPIKASSIFLNSCGAASIYRPAVEAQTALAERLAQLDMPAHPQAVAAAREAGARLFAVDPSDISLIGNCTTGLNLIANGYPFGEGDEVLTYRYEYPANIHPWALQERRGVRVRYLEGEFKEGRPHSLSLDEIAKNITDRTRIVALSHVQFASGFAVDLPKLAALCKAKGVDLVLDAAQSAGCLPVHPETLGISAVVTSGWKWLCGPIGIGLMYTEPKFRDRIELTMAGPDHMEQGDDYLDHGFRPYSDGRKFEPSTLASGPAIGLATALDGISGRYKMEHLWGMIRETQDALLAELPDALFQYANHSSENRSGILSFGVHGEPYEVSRALAKEGILSSVRGQRREGDTIIPGWLRLAPHFFVTPEEAAAAGKRITAITARVLREAGIL